MGPEFGIGMGREAGSDGKGPPRPSLLIRGAEMAGLGLLVLGLGNWRWWQIALGGAMVIGSYAVYRWQHGPQTGAGGGLDGPDSDAGDSGGD